MIKGIIFAHKEFSVHDGPGIRETVFLKGCPLRCFWCHNPEGQSFEKEILFKKNLCLDCGKCKNACESRNCCVCGKCVTLCIHGAREICGEELTAGEFAGRILKHGDFLRQNKGGVTISGGEPLAQPDFLIELLNALKEFHIALDTSGYGESKIFKEAIRKVKLVLFDIKLTDPELHIKHTGKDNRFILENLSFLVSSSIPFYVRMPVIPGLNDNEEHFRKTAELVKNAPGLLGIDILPYQHTAGAKYSQLGRIYNPSFDQTGKITIPDYIFTQYFIRSRIL